MELLKHFKELTVYPKNAEELKGLILQLAVQGKLTAHWRKQRQLSGAEVEPASELLKRIATEKQRLVREKKMKKEKPLPRILNSDFIDELPSSWKWCRFGEIVINRDGDRKPITKSDRIQGNYDYYGASGVIDKVNDYIFDKDLLLVGEDGANLITRSTPIAFFARGKYWVNNHAHVIDATHFTVLEYLEKYINGIGLEDYLTGMAQPKMPQKRMNVIPVPLPPLEEQKTIVAIVNQLFAEVEQLEALTKQRISLKEDFATSALQRLTQASNTQEEWAFLQEHFSTFFTEKSSVKQLRESILQLAVQGKLTAHWRALRLSKGETVEPASELLKRITAEKQRLVKEKKIKQEKPLPPISKEEIPYALPEGWEWCRFGELITFLNGYAFKSSTYVPDSKFQVIRLGNVKNDEFLIDTKEAYVPESIAVETLNYKLNQDDILTTLTGTKDKRDYCFTCLVKGEHLKDRILLLNQRVGCIRAIDKSSSELLNKFLKSAVVLDQLFATETGTANQGNIGSTSFKNVVFPLPPLQEQKVIVEKVNALMALCDELEAQIEKSQTQVAQLMQSCLREVFEN